MSDSWNRHRRRRRLLVTVLDEVARTGRLPVTPGVLAEFGDLDGLLLAVHHRWFTAFTAHLDAVLEDQPADLPAAVAELWWSLAREHAAARAVLDAHRERPALRAADERQRQTLLGTVGVDLAALPEPRIAVRKHCPLARWWARSPAVRHAA